MMRHWTLASLAFALSTPGCLGLGSGTPATRSYVLTAAARAPAATPEEGKPGAIGVGPVSVPRFLDRPQIVTMTGGNEVALAELDRWAEPLADGITRALAADLAILLPGARVERHPWPAQLSPELELRVDVLRFEGVPGGTAVVEVRWLLRRGKQEVASRVSRREAIASAAGHGGLVTAWSHLLAGVAEEIAGEIAQQRE